MYYFVDAKQAMAWATEILRKRRFPKNGRFYMDAVGDEAHGSTPDGQAFYATAEGNLPTTADERAFLATKS